MHFWLAKSTYRHDVAYAHAPEGCQEQRLACRASPSADFRLTKAPTLSLKMAFRLKRTVLSVVPEPPLNRAPPRPPTTASLSKIVSSTVLLRQRGRTNKGDGRTKGTDQ